MTPEQASQIATDYDGAVKSGRYLEWDIPKLIGIKDQLREARVVLAQYPPQLQTCEAALAKINDRIEALKSAQASARKHTQTQLIAGFGLLLTTLGIVLAQCRGNKQPAMPKQSRTNAEIPKSSVQPTATPSPTQ